MLKYFLVAVIVTLAFGYESENENLARFERSVQYTSPTVGRIPLKIAGGNPAPAPAPAPKTQIASKQSSENANSALNDKTPVFYNGAMTTVGKLPKNLRKLLKNSKVQKDA